MRINIAIDGPSASGKSTLAKKLAQRLGYRHLDTGAMYRACAYNAYIQHIDLEDESSVLEMLSHMVLSFNTEGHILSNGEDLDSKIRTKEIDLLTSKISKLEKIRANLVEQQRKIASDKGYILDGRDIGSVVLPDAEIKIFQTASIESRAKRRCLEYQNKGIQVNYQTIYEEIKLRDLQDSTRLHSPLIKVKDSIEIDTSHLSIEETVDRILVLVNLIVTKEQK